MYEWWRLFYCTSHCGFKRRQRKAIKSMCIRPNSKSERVAPREKVPNQQPTHKCKMPTWLIFQENLPSNLDGLNCCDEIRILQTPTHNFPERIFQKGNCLFDIQRCKRYASYLSHRFAGALRVAQVRNKGGAGGQASDARAEAPKNQTRARNVNLIHKVPSGISPSSQTVKKLPTSLSLSPTTYIAS